MVSNEKVKVLVTQLPLTLCNPMDNRPPGSSVRGILQVRILEWVAISSSRDLPDPGIKTVSPALAGGFFTTEPPMALKEKYVLGKAGNRSSSRKVLGHTNMTWKMA